MLVGKKEGEEYRDPALMWMVDPDVEADDGLYVHMCLPEWRLLGGSLYDFRDE